MQHNQLVATETVKWSRCSENTSLPKIWGDWQTKVRLQHTHSLTDAACNSIKRLCCFAYKCKENERHVRRSLWPGHCVLASTKCNSKRMSEWQWLEETKNFTQDKRKDNWHARMHVYTWSSFAYLAHFIYSSLVPRVTSCLTASVAITLASTLAATQAGELNWKWKKLPARANNTASGACMMTKKTRNNLSQQVSDEICANLYKLISSSRSK